jgi:hypothetical protein
MPDRNALNMMEHIIKLLPLDIDSYSRILHIHEQMKWVLNDIRNGEICFACDKHIIKYVYSSRSRYCEHTFCSLVCLDAVIGTHT